MGNNFYFVVSLGGLFTLMLIWAAVCVGSQTQRAKTLTLFTWLGRCFDMVFVQVLWGGLKGFFEQSRKQAPQTAAPVYAAQSGLVECEDCGGQVSPRAAACPHCGAPCAGAAQTAGSMFWGICPNCNTNMKKVKKATSEGSGCILFLIGLIFAPVLIGIPVIVFGIILMMRTEKYWLCRGCGSRF